MMGRNHLVVGTVSGVSAVMVLWRTQELTGRWEPVAELSRWTTETLLPWQLVGDLLGPWWAVLWWGGCLVALWWGSLVCDIDSSRSLLGRYVPFPGPHHGIAHTYWPVALVLGALVWWGSSGVFAREFDLLVGPVAFSVLGQLSHLWVDGRSRASIVGLWPLWPAWKTIRLGDGNGSACVVPRVRRGGYRVGTLEEKMMLVAVLVFHVLLWGACLLV